MTEYVLTRVSSLLYKYISPPVSASISSSKVKTRELNVFTFVASSVGLEVDNVGLVASSVVKRSLFELLSIPTKEFPPASSNAVVAISI